MRVRAGEYVTKAENNKKKRKKKRPFLNLNGSTRKLQSKKHARKNEETVENLVPLIYSNDLLKNLEKQVGNDCKSFFPPGGN